MGVVGQLTERFAGLSHLITHDPAFFSHRHELRIKKTAVSRIFVNGKTAEKYYIRYIEKTVGQKAVCLPSTSPANAAWSLDRLINAWQIIK